jgi:hypothetical protein
MREFDVSEQDLTDLRAFVLRYREWPAIFGCNYSGQIWPWLRWGNHDSADRQYVHGLHPLLDALVAAYLDVRPQGGRVFINEEGVFYKDEAYPDQRFQVLRFRVRQRKRVRV